jgi:hypothetical protein
MLCTFYALHYPSLRHHHAFHPHQTKPNIKKRHVVKTNNLQNQCRAITKVMMPIFQSLSVFFHLHHTFFFHFIHLFISCSASPFPSPSHIIVQKVHGICPSTHQTSGIKISMDPYGFSTGNLLECPGNIYLLASISTRVVSSAYMYCMTGSMT